MNCWLILYDLYVMNYQIFVVNAFVACPFVASFPRIFSHLFAKIPGFRQKKLIKLISLRVAAAVVPIPHSIYCVVYFTHDSSAYDSKAYLWATNELITIVNSYWRLKEFKWESRWNVNVYGEGGGVGGCVLCIIVCTQVFEEENEKKWNELKNEP